MTSQIVLFNGYGVAIASDSALTMAGSRVYDTAEKIIPLAEPNQFAILWSGSSHLHGYPYALLINEWKKSLGETSLPNATKYAESFVAWVESSSLFDDFQQLVEYSRLVDGFLNETWSEIDDLRESKFALGEELTEDDCEKVINDRNNRFLNWPVLHGASKGDWYSQLEEEIADWIKERIEYWFDDVPWTQSLESSLRNSLETYIVHSCIESSQRATLAFVGYGTNEVMPSYFELEVRAFFGDSMLWRFKQLTNFDASSGSKYIGVKLLAQHDAISTFIAGIDDQTYNRLKNEMLSGRNESSADSDGTDLEARTSKVESAFGRNEKMERFNNVAALMPVGSLVSVAESLIGIQSLSQAVNGELNTVGGPIDTAVITRQTGFSWVRRKRDSNSGG